VKRGAWGIGGSIALAALLAGCGHGAPGADRRPPTTTSPGSPPAASPGSTTTTTGSDEAASLPVVRCPTTFALSTPPPTVPLPTSLIVHVPSTLTTPMAVYADSNNIMKLLAPAGWSCSAFYGADGSGRITVEPSGEPLPASGQVPSASDQAISATETGGSPVQAAAAGCAFFPAAAAANESDLDQGCSPRPKSEMVDPISSTVVGFEDAPGIKGSGEPSGGPDPANGVMTYSPTVGPGFYLDTCTLPQDEHATCTAVLNYFITLYGRG
jgi:hypothetical protein